MTPTDIRIARRKIGEMWGLGRPLTLAELGRALRMAPASSEKTIIGWEKGTPPSGPVTVALSMMLDGGHPPDREAILSTAKPAAAEPVN